jgi:prepilin-type N-terminal cleavage/methylation domain-containing protein
VKRNAFTLIELLVVIAIIAILSGLLVTALSRRKVATARAISGHSLGQMIAAGNLYRAEHDNSFWPYRQNVPGGVQWWFGFETSASTGMPEGKRTCDYSKGPLGAYASASGGVKADPAFQQFSPRLKPKYANGNFGYGYNVLLAADSTGAPRNAARVEDPSQMIVFATCAQVNTFQSPASSKRPMIEEFYMIDHTQRTAHFRHGSDALAAFLDGSVRPLSMEADMVPGSLDARIPSANIGVFKTKFVKQADW